MSDEGNPAVPNLRTAFNHPRTDRTEDRTILDPPYPRWDEAPGQMIVTRGVTASLTPAYAEVAYVDEQIANARQAAARGQFDTTVVMFDHIIALRADLVRRLHFIEGACAMLAAAVVVLGIIVSVGR